MQVSRDISQPRLNSRTAVVTAAVSLVWNLRQAPSAATELSVPLAALPSSSFWLPGRGTECGSPRLSS